MSMRKSHLILCCLMVVAIVRPAAAQNVDPDLAADITRLMDVLNVTQNTEQLGGVMAQQIVAMMKTEHPDAPPRVLNIVSELIKTKFTASVGGREGLIARTVSIYAK